MSRESIVSYQRNRLRTLDTAMILLISIFSILLTGVNFTLGEKFAVAMLPLLIPILIFPLINGVIIGIILKDSLKWRARGWEHFFVGFIGSIIVFLTYYTGEVSTLPYDNLFSYVLIVPLSFLIYYVYPRIGEFYERGFRLIRVAHDMDKDFHQDGLWSSFLIAGSTTYWSMTLLDITASNFFIDVFFIITIFFSGVNIWVLSGLGARDWLSDRAYSVIDYTICPPLLTVIFLPMGLFFGFT